MKSTVDDRVLLQELLLEVLRNTSLQDAFSLVNANRSGEAINVSINPIAPSMYDEALTHQFTFRWEIRHVSSGVSVGFPVTETECAYQVRKLNQLWETKAEPRV